MNLSWMDARCPHGIAWVDGVVCGHCWWTAPTMRARHPIRYLRWLLGGRRNWPADAREVYFHRDFTEQS